MFEVNKSYKVKVELAPGQFGFGHARVILKEGNHLFIRLKTSKESHKTLPKGTKLWFVGNSALGTFNGVWSTSVIGQQIVSGKVAMKCASLKFAQTDQKRTSLRRELTYPVVCQPNSQAKTEQKVQLKDISSSGLALKLPGHINEEHWNQKSQVDLVVKSPLGDIPLTCSVVHSEYNWLNNLTTVGLKITSIEPKVKKLWDELLNQEEAPPPPSEGQLKGKEITPWLKGSKTRQNPKHKSGKE